MMQRLTRLVDVKSIVTIALTAVFAYLSATGKVDTNQFLTVFTVIIAFYFGTQSQKAAPEAVPGWVRLDLAPGSALDGGVGDGGQLCGRPAPAR